VILDVLLVRSASRERPEDHAAGIDPKGRHGVHCHKPAFGRCSDDEAAASRPGRRPRAAHAADGLALDRDAGGGGRLSRPCAGGLPRRRRLVQPRLRLLLRGLQRRVLGNLPVMPRVETELRHRLDLLQRPALRRRRRVPPQPSRGRRALRSRSPVQIPACVQRDDRRHLHRVRLRNRPVHGSRAGNLLQRSAVRRARRMPPRAVRVGGTVRARRAVRGKRYVPGRPLPGLSPCQVVLQRRRPG
jgi:hypothetical protein